MKIEERNKKNDMVINLGLISNIGLSIMKVLVGILGHSQALLADGINSTSDVIYYLVVKILIRFSKKPPDDRHPYGHLQLESIASVVVGAFIVTTALAIFWNSLNSIYDRIIHNTEVMFSSNWTIVIALITVVLKIFLRRFSLSVYKKTSNPAIKALAHDHLNDLMASIAVTFGILFSKLGYGWVDPLAGAIVAIFILKTGIEILHESSFELMDTFPDSNFKKTIESMVLSEPEIEKLEDLGVHRFGPKFILNLTIQIDGQLSVYQGNMIADKLEEKLFEEYDKTLCKVNIHYHPIQKK